MTVNKLAQLATMDIGCPAYGSAPNNIVGGISKDASHGSTGENKHSGETQHMLHREGTSPGADGPYIFSLCLRVYVQGLFVQGISIRDTFHNLHVHIMLALLTSLSTRSLHWL